MDMNETLEKVKKIQLEVKEKIQQLVNKYGPFLDLGLEIIPPSTDEYTFANGKYMFAFIEEREGRRVSNKLALLRNDEDDTSWPIWSYDGKVPLWILLLDKKENILAAIDNYDKYVEDVLKKIE